MRLSFCLAIVALLSIVTAAGPARALTVPGPSAPTIQAAIDAVVSGAQPDGAVIDVMPGTYAEALVISGTAKSLTIQAAGGAGTVTVNAAGRGVSALRISNATGTIRIDGLTFTGGSATQGGGANLFGSAPTLANVTFAGNTAVDGGGASVGTANPTFDRCVFRNNTASRFGGGLVITGGAKPVFTDTVIQNNVSGTGSPIGSGGGVTANDASPTFVRSSIVGNTSRFAGGGIFHQGLFGSPQGTALLILQDSEVSFNTTVRFNPNPGTSDNPAEGGGVHIEDNAIGRLTDVRVRNNVAGTAGGLSAFRARYELTRVVVEGNRALDPLGVGGFGGGINLNSNNPTFPLQQAASIDITDSVVRNNQGFVGGGILVVGDNVCGGGACTPAAATKATLSMTNSLVDKNSATLRGGGVLADRANATITGSHVLQNQVLGPSATFGGGLMLTSATTANITSTVVASNAAQQVGGGIFIDIGGVVNIDGAMIYENQAGSGGGIFVGGNGPPTGTVQNSVIADNTNFQVRELTCPGTQLNYQANHIAISGGGNVYSSNCGQAATLSGNDSLAPTFVSFLATPSTTPSVLSWSAARKTGVTISGVGSFARTGSVAVTTATAGCPTTFTLTPQPSGAPASRPVNCGTQADASLALQLNSPAFRTGDTMVLTATVAPGAPPLLVDAYLVIRVPGGGLFSLQGNGSAVAGVAPAATGFMPFPITAQAVQYTFTGSELAGTYSWFGFLTRSGSFDMVSILDQDDFTFAP